MDYCPESWPSETVPGDTHYCAKPPGHDGPHACLCALYDIPGSTKEQD